MVFNPKGWLRMTSCSSNNSCVLKAYTSLDQMVAQFSNINMKSKLEQTFK